MLPKATRVTGIIDIVNLVLVVSVFGIVMAIWSVGLLIWVYRSAKRAEKVQQRLGLRQEQPDGTRVLRLWHEGQEATTTVSSHARHLRFGQRLGKLFRNAGWKAPPRTILLGVGATMAMAAMATLALTRNFPATITVALSVVMIFWIYAKQRVTKRATLFEKQFIDAIGLASRSLHAGHPLTGAFRLISEEIAAPVGPLFEDICQQQALGVSLETALRNTASTSDSPDMKMFTTSVIMQLRSGGNLADMMSRLAEVIRDRMRLARRVRVLTAQTQFSKRVLLAMPIIVFAILNAMSPTYMEPLYTSVEGKVLLLIAAAGLLLGYWIMSRMAQVRY